MIDGKPVEKTTLASKAMSMSDQQWISLAGILVLDTALLSSIAVTQRTRRSITFSYTCRLAGGKKSAAITLLVAFEGDSIEFHSFKESPKNVITPRATNIFYQKLIVEAGMAKKEATQEDIIRFVRSCRAQAPDHYIFPSQSLIELLLSVDMTFEEYCELA